MQQAISPSPVLDADGRPGLTSLVRTGRGLMTVQTELLGEPAELITIVDFRGRVLKTWRSPFRVDSTTASAPEQIRNWHREIEQRLRRQLAAVARKRAHGDVEGDVLARMFVAGMQAYGQRDFSTAHALFEVCEHLRPGDARVQAALDRTRGR